MGVKSLRLRPEVEALRHEPAVDLGAVVRGEAPEFIREPAAFFERTHLTSSMKALVVKALMGLLGLREAVVGRLSYRLSSNLIVLPSDLGGGKTHSLVLLYHVLSTIASSKAPEEAYGKLRVLDEDIAGFVRERWSELKGLQPKVVVVDCKYSDLAPSPVKPLAFAGKRIKTIWGYIAYELGRYDEVREFDEREVAPYQDVLFRVLNESNAVILVDEIGRYYDQSGLEPTKVSSFLMNLAEALTKYTTRNVVVVLSIPVEVAGREGERRASGEVLHRHEVFEAVTAALRRVGAEVVKPVAAADLVEILKRRILDHSPEELRRMAEEYVAAKLRAYPPYMSMVLDDRRFWDEVRRTYPFHPAFVELVEKLAYRLPNLQRTRDAIRIAAHTVLAIKRGLADWLDEDPDLVMPYHVPVFAEEVLANLLMWNAPRELAVFTLILRSNVAVPRPEQELASLDKRAALSSVVAAPLKDLSDERKRVAAKLGIVIWLHSLIGAGLPSNIGLYPSTADLVYSLSPTDEDLSSVIPVLPSILPQLVTYAGAPADISELTSRNVKWFFVNVPSVDELIESIKRNIPASQAVQKLAELLERVVYEKRGPGRPPKQMRTESIFRVKQVVKSLAEVAQEALAINEPVLIAVAGKVSKDELLGVLRGRNNVVVLAPHVSGVDEEERVLPEDASGFRELAGYVGKPAWDALVEILRYLCAANSIQDKEIESYVGVSILRHELVNKELLDSMREMMKSKVERKREYYENCAWYLIAKCYSNVYYSRLGDVKYVPGLVVERDKYLAPIVEDLLRSRGLIPDRFTGDDLLSIVRNYLGKDPTREPVSVGALWSFIKTTDKANVPIVSYDQFEKAVEDLVRSGDYAVRVKGVLVWKPVFASRSEAEASDEGEVMLRTVKGYLSKLGATWSDAELVYWELVFDEWLKKLLESVPRDKKLMVVDRSGSELDVRDIRFEVKSAVKSGKLFYAERKYIVDVDLAAPSELKEGEEYEAVLRVAVEKFAEEVTVKLSPTPGLAVEPAELRGVPPLECRIKLKAGAPGRYALGVAVYGAGKKLEERSIPLTVRGRCVEIAKPCNEIEAPNTTLLYVEAGDLQALWDMIKLLKSCRGTAKLTSTFTAPGSEASITVTTPDPRWLEALQSALATLATLAKSEGARVDAKLLFKPEGEVSAEIVRDKRYLCIVRVCES